MIRSSLVSLFAAALLVAGCSSSSPGTQNLQPGAPDPAHSTVTVDPASALLADGNAQATITVTLRDANNKPVPGQTVTLQVTGSGNTLSTPAATGADGTTTAKLTSTVAENKTINASVAQGALTPATVSFVAGGVDPMSSTVEVSPASVVADGTAQATITLTARDAHGNPVSGKAVSVNATGTDNTFGPKNATDTSGVSTTTLASSRAEAKTVTATVDGVVLAQKPQVTFTAGAASQLLFRVNPSSAVAGAVITPAVEVEVVDANGNRVDSSASITLGLGNGPTGAVLGGTVTVAAVNGIATFSDLSLDKASASYTLVASSAGLPQATSSAFQITAGASNHLVFRVQPPSSGTSGTALSPAIQVAFEDASGNVVTSMNDPVTLVLTGVANGAQLSGTVTVNALNGVATFNDLSVDKVGSGYAFGAITQAAGVAGASSTQFAITAGAAAKLAFTVQPSNVAAGSTISPAVVVAVEDAAGNLVTSASATVTLSLAANPGNDWSGGGSTVSQTVVNGLASFGALTLTHAANGYSFNAQSSGLASVVSNTFNVSAASASKLVFSQQPTNVAAGAAISPAVQVAIQDAYGNLTSSTTSITVGLGTNPGGATLTGTTTAGAVNGVASFSDLKLDKVGTGYTLTAVGQSVTSATSNTFNVTSGAPAQLVFTREPANATAGSTMASVQVTVEDANGNTVTTSTAAITVAIGTNPANGTLSGTKTISAVNGVASFATLSIDKAATGYTLAASSGTLTATSSTSFDITPGSPMGLAFLVQPTDVSAGSAIAPAVKVAIVDQFGNVVPTASDTISFSLYSSQSSGGTLSGAAPVTTTGGVATFSNLSIDKVDSYQLTPTSSGGLSGASSNLFLVKPGAPNKLAFAQQPTNGTAGTALSAVSVEVDDAYGNFCNSASNILVNLALSPNPTGATLSGTTSYAVSNGVVVFQNLSVDKAGSGYGLSATASGLKSASSTPFNIAAGPATKLVFTVQPATTAAGQAISPAVQVTAQDGSGNTATSFTGAVTVAIGNNPASGTLSGTRTVNATAGVATFSNLSIDKAGTGYTLTTSASGLTAATSAAFDITPGAATHLAFTRSPSNGTAGAALSPSVQVAALDANGNTVTSFTGSVTVAIGTNPGSATLSGTTNVPASSGVASFSNLSLNKAGTGYTLTATSSGLTSATSASFDIAAGTASKLLFSQQPSSATAGSAISPALQVTAQDAFGNTATSFTGAVSLTVGSGPSGASLSGGSATASAGVASFPNVVLTKAGSYTLVAAASGLTNVTSNSFSVSAASASQLVFSQQPGNVVAGAAITPSVKVSAEDAYGNVDTGFTGTVAVALGVNPGNTTLNGTASTSASAGVATFSNLSLNKAANGYTLTASASVGSAVSNSFNVTAATASQLAFTVQPSNVVAGSAISPAVQVSAVDAYGNATAAFSGTVTVALGNNTTGATLSGTSSVTATNGVASFSTLKVDKAGTGYTLTASAPNMTSATSTGFDVSSNAATQLKFTAQPQNVVAGNTFASIQVTALDANGNVSQGFTGTVTLSLANDPTNAVLSGTTTANASAGVATFSNVSLGVAGTGYTMGASSGTLTAATSVAFNVSPAAASKLVFVQGPVSAMNDQTMQTVKVAVEDSYGNVVTTDTRQITVALGTNPTNAVLSGTKTVAASAGVASYLDLSINLTGTGYTLTATDSNGTNAVSAAFDITPAPITGTEIAHYVQLDGGIIDQPVDLSASTIAAYVPLSTGGFNIYNGTGTANGTFSIPGVPTTQYYLRKDAAYYGPSSYRSWDFGFHQLGRPTSVLADAGTQLAVNIAGLTNFDVNNDDMQWYSANVGAWGSNVNCADSTGACSGPPDAGMNWQATLDYSATTYFWLPYLVDGTQGDQATLFHLSTVSTPFIVVADGGTVTSTTNYLAATEALTVAPVMVNGGVTSISGTMSPLTQNQRVSATIDFPAFANQVLSSVPDGGLFQYTQILTDGTLFPQYGQFGSTPDLMELTVYDSTAASQGMSFTFGTIDPSMPLIAYSGAQARSPNRVTFAVDGGTSTGGYLSAYSQQIDLASNFYGSTVAPKLGGVQAILINGRDANQALSGVGLTPTISWTAPTLGTVTKYRVLLRQANLDPSTNRVSFANIASVTSIGTSVQIPPGLLQTGKTYNVVVTAYDDAAGAFPHPGLTGYPRRFTQVPALSFTP